MSHSLYYIIVAKYTYPKPTIYEKVISILFVLFCLEKQAPRLTSISFASRIIRLVCPIFGLPIPCGAAKKLRITVLPFLKIRFSLFERLG